MTLTARLLVISSIIGPVQVIPLVLLGLILGLPGALVIITAHSWTYVVWMLIYLVSLPIWNFVLPTYAFWKFDDFSWGDTRKTAGETKKGGHGEQEGEFDSSQITMKRWAEFERERRSRSQYFPDTKDGNYAGNTHSALYSPGPSPGYHNQEEYYSDV